MSFDGILIGAVTFFIIGALHPIVIKAEYHLGKQIWPVFLFLGLICIFASILISDILFSASFAVLGFSLLWSIRELFEQEQRVMRGWFPANPNKNSYTTRK